MGEDAQDLPSPDWHVDLQQGCESPKYSSSRIVVDLSEMFGLVGHDWGFLLRLSELKSLEGVELVLISGEQVMKEAKILLLNNRFRIVKSIEESL